MQNYDEHNQGDRQSAAFTVMTERQLLLTHRKLTGIELGSITDLM
jgi:hypothetical protein